MKLEIILIQNDMELIHRSVSTVDDTINPYTAAINAIINELTGNVRPKPKIKESDKFKEAVPDYKPPVEELPKEKGLKFHPDLVKAGVAPTTEIPVVKLDMKTIFKDKK